MLQEIKLINFRNFRNKNLKISPEITVILGPNASGKTNILEAINLLSTGKSFRARVSEEMINYEAELARVACNDLEVVLTRGVIRRGSLEEKTARKRFLVNGVGKRLMDFSSILKTVVFRPADLELVTESPSIRRNFLDTVLSQVDYEYRKCLSTYEKGLRRRNKLLYAIREQLANRSSLYFWNNLLIKNGDYVTRKRADLIDFINKTEPMDGTNYTLEYDRSVISNSRLEQYKREEIAAAKTLVGPHRDDFCFVAKSRDLAKYGSRGEQRMGVLWLKLSELMFIEKSTEDKPILLLDDIFSELDHEHRDLVQGLLDKQQTIMTTADPHFVENLGKVEKILLNGL